MPPPQGLIDFYDSMASHVPMNPESILSDSSDAEEDADPQEPCQETCTEVVGSECQQEAPPARPTAGPSGASGSSRPLPDIPAPRKGKRNRRQVVVNEDHDSGDDEDDVPLRDVSNTVRVDNLHVHGKIATLCS